MNFNIKVNESAISRLVAGFTKDLAVKTDKAIAEAAIKQRNSIRARTLRGKGLKGAFAKYTPEYANYRSSKGRGRKPNLSFSGQMLGSMITVNGKGYAKIKFSRLSEAIKASGNQRKRPFFGITQDEKKDLTRFIRGRLK